MTRSSWATAWSTLMSAIVDVLGCEYGLESTVCECYVEKKYRIRVQTNIHSREAVGGDPAGTRRWGGSMERPRRGDCGGRPPPIGSCIRDVDKAWVPARVGGRLHHRPRLPCISYSVDEF